MGEDISRSTFDASKRYSAVRQQQGRVNLDADWNEQIDIAAHRLGTQTRDMLGYSSAPRDNAGFALTAPGTAAGFAANDLTISAGRIYVAGHLCELSGTAVAIENFTGDGTANAGTQVQLASVVIDGIALQPGQWVQIFAQGSPSPGSLLAQVTAVNAAAGSVTFSTSVSSFGPPNTSPQLLRVTTYLTQPDYPSPPPLPTSGNAIVYLDVWERPINSLDDPAIQEIALGGPDTTTRTKTVWQVKCLALPTGSNVSCSTPDSEIAPWSALTQPSGSLLTNGVQTSSSPGPCSISSGAGFTGMENQLYRVEIHQPGTPSSSAGPVTFPLAAGTATFKWSRDNASVTTSVTAVASSSSSTGAATSQLTVQSTGRDAVLSFAAQDWIEITDDFLELSGIPGELHRIDSNGVDTTRATITLATPISSALQARLTSTSDYHTRIIRWDQRGQIFVAGTGTLWADLNAVAATGDIPVPPLGTGLVLENGITVTFGLSSTTAIMNAADAWTFAARAATGSIESLIQAPPSAIHHSYCRLGTISFDALPWAISDCRELFAPLSDPGIHVTAVSLTTLGQTLLNDSTITVQQLAAGISITVDGALDPASVRQPDNTLIGNTPALSTNQATSFVTVGLPIVSGATIFGFQSVVLGATVSLDTSQTTINWLPAPGVTGALATQMTTIATETSPAGSPAIVPTLLASLTLKGNSIWSASDSSVFLDGETLGTPYLDANGVQRTGLLLPSGDGRRGGDFSMWFWLTSPPAPPPITLSATALAFVPTPLNTSSFGQSLQLTNTTGNVLPVTIGCTGDFSEVNTCATSIPANGTCLVTITFKPTQAGDRSGSLTITTGNTNLTVPLSGTGVPFQLQAIPTAVNFGTQNVGTTGAPQVVTLTNNGAASTPIVITGVGTASTSYPHSTTCSSLAAGQSCTITIQFAPQTAGSHPDALTVNTVPAGLLAPIPLSGTGITKNTVKEAKDAKDIPDNAKKNVRNQLEQIVRPINFTPVVLPKEAATGKSFIAAEERPAVGQQVLEEPK